MIEEIFREGRRGKQVRPFSDLAGVSARGSSRPLRRRLADFAAERSGRDVIGAMREHYGIEASLHAVNTALDEASKAAVIFNLDRPQRERPAETLVVEIDGSMVPLVRIKTGEGDARKRRSCHWGEVRLCTARDIRDVTPRYGACFGPALESGLMMGEVARSAGQSENTKIHGIGDGASWIATQFEDRFGTAGSYLIDFYHVCEYLAAAAPTCGARAEDPAATHRWFSEAKDRLRSGAIRGLIEELALSIEPADIPEEDAPVRKCHRYMENRKNNFFYPEARAAGLPIGSGEVESGHRHVIQQRLKLPGAWWKKETASNVIQLRVTRSNGEWSELCLAMAA